MVARERRVALHEIGAYRGNPDTAAPGGLAVGFGNVKEGAIESAIAAVADLLADKEATAPGTEHTAGTKLRSAWAGNHRFEGTWSQSALASAPSVHRAEIGQARSRSPKGSGWPPA
jgi:hypothetical protein